MSIVNTLPKLIFISLLATVVLSPFSRAQITDEQSELTGDSRQVWFNRNYNLLLKKVSESEWQEVEVKTGKIWSKFTFVKSTPDYVELWILERKNPKRIYKDHCEDFENGKWVTTASGEWQNIQAQVIEGKSSPSEVDDWTKAKETYLQEIDESIERVIAQLDAIEEETRSKGDLQKLEKVSEWRTAFTERGELFDTVNRDEYDLVRKKSVAMLADRKKAIIVRLLESKQDASAQQIDSEFRDLIDPFQADLFARWSVAVKLYHNELTSAKSLILTQLSKKEEQARENALPSAVEEAKSAIKVFKERGIIMKGVNTSVYEMRLKSARDKLERVNKSLVRSLLLAKKDGKARDMLNRFELEINSVAKSESNGLQVKKRKTWENESYQTRIQQIQSGDWTEVKRNGKLERKLKEVAKNEKFIEVLMLDRRQPMRLYDDHADIFKDGKWIWVAKGSWIE